MREEEAERGAGRVFSPYGSVSRWNSEAGKPPSLHILHCAPYLLLLVLQLVRLCVMAAPGFGMHTISNPCVLMIPPYQYVLRDNDGAMEKTRKHPWPTVHDSA